MEELIRLCQQNDGKAQRRLYEKCATPLFRLCCRYLRNPADAEDAHIKGFLKVFQNIGLFSYRGEGSLEAWMRRIMVNECLMLLRKAGTFGLATESLEQLEVDANVCLDSDLAAEDIYALIRQMPDGYRTVFNLYVLEGYPHKEIADLLGISENTSKSQLSKARAMLRMQLTKQDLPYEARRT